MYVVVIAWMYVVLLMSVAEALSSQGTVLGAVFTFLLYGLLPLSIVVYILGTPARKKARARREAAEMAEMAETAELGAASPDADARSQAAVGAAGAVAPKREEG